MMLTKVVGLNRALLRGRSFASTSAGSLSTIGSVLDHAVASLPHKEALRAVDQDIRWSFKEFNEYVDELANGFHSLRLKKGDVLAIWLPNNAESLVAQFAAAKSGITIATIDNAVQSEEDLAFALSDSNCTALLFEPKISAHNNTEIVHAVLPEISRNSKREIPFSSKTFPQLDVVITTAIDEEPGMAQFRHILVNSAERHELEARLSAAKEESPAVINYSANKKKSSVFTHADILKKASALATSINLKTEDKICISESNGGFSTATLAAFLKNAQVVLPASERDEQKLIHALKLEECSIVGADHTEYKRV